MEEPDKNKHIDKKKKGAKVRKAPILEQYLTEVTVPWQYSENQGTQNPEGINGMDDQAMQNFQDFQDVMGTKPVEPPINTLEKDTKHEDFDDMEELKDVQITVSVHTLRNVLKMRKSVWSTILMLVANSIVQIESATMPEPVDTKHLFKPVEPQEGPLFNLMPNGESLTQVERGNLTLTIQPYEEGPFLMSTIDSATQGYHCITNIVDLKKIAVDAHNSRKFLEDHNEKQEYRNQMGFQSKFKSNVTTSKEYLLYPNAIGYEECELICPMLESQLPQGHEELKEASEVFDIPNKYIWMTSTQKTEVRRNWNWKQMYNYWVFLDDVQIYPQKKGPMSGFSQCTAYKDNKPVSHQDIGYHYKYFNSGEYHKHRPYKMEVAMSAGGDCKIIAPNIDHSTESVLDDNTCICQRKKPKTYYASNELEADQLHRQLAQEFKALHIEDWRYKTPGNYANSILEVTSPVEGPIQPRYVNFSRDRAASYKKKYLKHEDLTNLKISVEKTNALKAKDFFTGVAKILMTNPSLITNLHEKITDYISPDKGITARQTDNIVGNDEEFATQINQFENFHITRKNSIISVTPTEGKTMNWAALNQSASEEAAEEGIRQTRRNILDMHTFEQEILPTIIEELVISRLHLHEHDVAFGMDTLIQQKHYGSYIVLKIFVPVLLKQNTRIHTIAPLPFKYMELTNTYIVKKLPAHLSLEAGATSPGTFGPDTPCALAVIKNHDHIQLCENMEKSYNNINKLMTIDRFDIYLLKKIGTVSISCPQTKLKWMTFDFQINILILHASCFLESRGGEYNLVIKPNITEPPQALSSMLLMAYNINQKWVPSIKKRWILQLGTMVTIVLLLISLCICCLTIVKHTKCFTHTRQVVVSETVAKTAGASLKDKIFNKKQKTIQKNQKKTQKDNQNEETTILNEDTKRNSYMEFEKYDEDYPTNTSSTYFEETFGPELEQYFATVKRNPRRSHHDSKTLEDKITPKTIQDKTTAQLHWRFPDKSGTPQKPNTSDL